jgi:crotonobetainyl-CoA:carnitine CoA-transferase CaiB-like acyl-CoA transferase
MSPIAPALAALSGRIAELSGVDVAALGITDRRGELPLREPGRVSPNGACRLVRAADGWIAVNLAREEDRELIPAWLEGETEIEAAAARPWRRLTADAALLGLPVAGVGEIASGALEPPQLRLGPTAARPHRPKVVDLSALWAGPMCGAILAAAGADVTRIESLSRPDPTRTHTPEFFRRLNGAKAEVALDLTGAEGKARVLELILSADLVITSARARGLASLGLDLGAIFAAKPGLVWVAITGYGLSGDGAMRVAFGDDAAAAGGLVRWTADGPEFLGDAVADPVTGLAAAAGALQALRQGGGVLVDAAMARCAAGAAAACGLRQAA